MKNLRTNCIGLLLAMGVVLTSSLHAAKDQVPKVVQAATIKVGEQTVLKGLAIEAGDGQKASFCYDTETMQLVGVWKDKFINPIRLMSRGDYPVAQGKIEFGNDARLGGLSGNVAEVEEGQTAVLPGSDVQFRGFHRFENRITLSYEIGGVGVLEHPWYDGLDGVYHRTFRVASSDKELRLLVAKDFPTKAGIVEKVGNGAHGYVVLNEGGTNMVAVGILDGPKEAAFEIHEEHLYLKLPAREKEGAFQLQIWAGKDEEKMSRFIENFHNHPPFMDPAVFTRGGGESWKETVTTRGRSIGGSGAFVVDTFGVPFTNPYESVMFLAGIDFFLDGRAAVCTFHGDVWVVSGLDDSMANVTWKRFASGLYHALGLKIVNDEVYVTGRDQITRLKDVDGNGEADFYGCFNNDCKITTNFHEFTMDLHTDAQGNFYFAKAGPVRKGGRGFEEIVEHHGTVMKLTPDGKELTVVATGLRAPNGMGVGPDGQITTGENEGTWTPRCRLNWVKPGGFYGVVDLAHRETEPTTYDPPLCWLPKSVDNSGGGQLWAASDKWGVLKDRLFHLSYGTCSLYLVLPQDVNGAVQGGVVKIPAQFQSGVMRGRMHPKDGQMYLVGMKGWQTSAVADGCLQRVRLKDEPLNLPLGYSVAKGQLTLRFSEPVDRELGEDVESFSVSHWDYVWSRSYGSPEIPVGEQAKMERNEKGEWSKDQMGVKARENLDITKATVSSDGKEVKLSVPGLRKAMQIRIVCNLETAEGDRLRPEIFGTIHQLPDAP